MRNWRHYRVSFRPSARSMVFIVLAAAALALCLPLAIAFALTADMEEPLGVSAFVYSLISSPIAITLLLVAGLLEKPKPAKALVFFLMALCVFMASIVLSIGFATDPDMGISGALGAYAMCCGPISLLAFVPTIVILRNAWSQLKIDVAERQEQAMIDLIRTQGRATLVEAAGESGKPLAEIANHIRSLTLLRELDAVVYEPEGLVFDKVTDEAAQSKLLAVLKAQGQASVDDLARTFQVSERIIREWVVKLVDQRDFGGYVNWREGMLYSADAARIREGGRCPNCSGPLELAGQGIVRCASCSTEFFLKRDG